jgi:uncharacterized protein YbjT (DUF2867 family)
VARCLIVGCGCRGLALAAQLRDRGHAIRGTTRNPARVPELEAVGVEAVVADPDLVATLAPALAQVGVLYVLLGTAVGEPERLAALHDTRLDMLLLRTLDSPIRGIVYERAGSVDAALLSAGAARVREACEGSMIPYVLLDADPHDHPVWLDAASAAVDTLLG